MNGTGSTRYSYWYDYWYTHDSITIINNNVTVIVWCSGWSYDVTMVLPYLMIVILLSIQ